MSFETKTFPRGLRVAQERAGCLTHVFLPYNALKSSSIRHIGGLTLALAPFLLHAGEWRGRGGRRLELGWRL